MNSEKGKKIKFNKGAVMAGILTFIIGTVIAVQMSTTGGEAQGALVPLAKVKAMKLSLQR